MDPTSLVTLMVGSQTARMQFAAAAMLARMNADNAGSIVQIVNAAEQNVASVANVTAGLGQNLNISV